MTKITIGSDVRILDVAQFRLWTQEYAFLSLLFLILVFLVKLDYNKHHIKSMRTHDNYQFKVFCRYSHARL